MGPPKRDVCWFSFTQKKTILRYLRTINHRIATINHRIVTRVFIHPFFQKVHGPTVHIFGSVLSVVVFPEGAKVFPERFGAGIHNYSQKMEVSINGVPPFMDGLEWKIPAISG